MKSNLKRETEGSPNIFSDESDFDDGYNQAKQDILKISDDLEPSGTLEVIRLKKENLIEDFKKKLLKKFKANDNIYYPYWKAEQFINEVEKELK